MKLVIDRGELLRGLGHVTSVVEKRTTIPILSNVLLNASEAGLRFRATDLEREVMEETRADVSQTGAATVPAHTLYDIARKLPDGAQVEIRRDNEKERLILSSGQSVFTLQTLAAEDFPDLSPGEFTHTFTIAAADLKRLIEKTRFAISTEETRYYLNGIYLHPATTDGKATLRAVATDGHRLAQAELPLPRGAEDMPGIILPRKTVQELVRLIESSEATVGVSVSASKIRFEIGSDKEVGGVMLTSKLIDGTFPDYARVIPRTNDKSLKVPNGAFVAAVDRVATIASDRGRAVKLNLSEGKLVLSVNNPEGGSATEEVAADYVATPLEVGFNARYLLDIAQQIESESAEFLLADAGSPTVVKDQSDGGSLYVLMPMRV
ncbi:MAG TPA: DNA polymerase III subunit beta [Hyphomicrobiaceae bacterium]|nr:DNA polymerase III subunit beta [Hyphomicrobiaceae bacterium]